jgi:hypothetical protein
MKHRLNEKGGENKMKKTLLMAVTVLFVLSFSGMVFAQDLQSPGTEEQLAMSKAKAMKYAGEVLSHDVKCHCIVVKGAKGNITLQDDYAKFDGEYDRAKGLKIGSKIAGEYKTVNYINYALSVNYTK